MAQRGHFLAMPGRAIRTRARRTLLRSRLSACRYHERSCNALDEKWQDYRCSPRIPRLDPRCPWPRALMTYTFWFGPSSMNHGQRRFPCITHPTPKYPITRQKTSSSPDRHNPSWTIRSHARFVAGSCYCHERISGQYSSRVTLKEHGFVALFTSRIREFRL